MRAQLSQQTIVVTGADQGLGLAVATRALEKGARVVMGTRNADLLLELKEQWKERAHIVQGDLTRRADLQRIADEAKALYGGVDSWVNATESGHTGPLLETDEEAERRLMELNFWSARWSSIIAVELMKETGGTLVNVGTETTVVRGPYSGLKMASRVAVGAFSDALRLELRTRKLPVDLCLLHPYEVEADAEALLRALESPVRDIYGGGPARLSAALDAFFPKVRDMMNESQRRTSL